MIEFEEADAAQIDRIKELWEGLNAHLRVRNPTFESWYRTFTFEQRKETLLLKASKGIIRIDIARDSERNRDVAYCVSTVLSDGMGEIDSIFVEACCRGQGIGSTLIERALSWMDGKGAKAKRVAITVGNEQVSGFYARFGFVPRMIVLERLPK